MGINKGNINKENSFRWEKLQSRRPATWVLLLVWKTGVKTLG